MKSCLLQNILIVSFVTLVVFSCSTINPTEPNTTNTENWPTIATTITPAIYQIGFVLKSNTYESTHIELVGTGFAISGHRIITNAHVANALASYADSLQPIAISSGSVRRIIPISHYSIHPYYANSISSADLAVLVVDSTLSDTLTIANNSELEALTLGTPIASLGFPGETSVWSLVSNTPTFKNGTISAFLPIDKADTTLHQSFFLQHNLDLTGGTSGSPIVGLNGHVVAVNNSGAFNTAIGWGISATYIAYLDTTTDLNAYSATTAQNRKTFTIGTVSSSGWIDQLPLEATTFSSVKQYFGYDYTILRENDSIYILGYTDHTTYQLLFVFEKGSFYKRSNDVVASLCITNTRNQKVPNQYSSLFYKEISIGSSKSTIQLTNGVCTNKKVFGTLLHYQYPLMYNNNIAFLFYESDEYCSAIALPGNRTAATVPYITEFDSTLIPKYMSERGGSIPLLKDTTLQIKTSTGLLLAERTYVNGILNGPFSEYYSNGKTLLSGSYVNGKKHGPFLTYDSSGMLLSLNTYNNDTIDGPAIQFFTGFGRISGDDTASCYSYSRGMLDGLYREFFENGKLYRQRYFTAGKQVDTLLEYYFDDTLKIRSVYSNDSLNGPYLEYFSDGRLKINAFYSMGNLDSTYKLYRISGDSTLVMEEKTYSNGKLNGISKSFDPTGKLLAEIPYKNNLLNGIDTRYYSSGKIESATPYENGILNGQKLQYFTDGLHIQYKSTYINGKLISKITYDITGKILIEERYP